MKAARTHEPKAYVPSRRPRIFTWHIHGTYLYYLSQGNYDIFIPKKADLSEGYCGKGSTFPFGDHVWEIPAEEVAHLDLDIILFQSSRNYLKDQYEILSEKQRSLPQIYLEHDPPRESPTETKHIVDDPAILLVHVTHFNRVMWNNNSTPVKVIDHGIIAPDVTYSGTLQRGIVVINNIRERGRRLGLDIFLRLRERIPLDIIGMGTEEFGLGEIKHEKLPEFISRYRFFFNPIRYTSLGLSILEAMMIGLPVVGLATTELVTVIQNGRSGYLHTDMEFLAEKTSCLLDNHTLARQIGEAGRKVVAERFNISRFLSDWEEAFQQVLTKSVSHTVEISGVPSV